MSAWLFVPGDRPERFAKAAASGADAVICDLEDAVAPANKPSARSAVAGWLREHRAYVRVNAAGTPWHERDVATLAGLPGLIGVMLPKAETPAEIRALGGVPVVPLVETAAGVENVAALATAPGVQRLAFGSIDFALDCGMDELDETLLYARSRLVLASRAARIEPPLDGVTAKLDDPAGDRARRPLVAPPGVRRQALHPPAPGRAGRRRLLAVRGGDRLGARGARRGRRRPRRRPRPRRDGRQAGARARAADPRHRQGGAMRDPGEPADVLGHIPTGADLIVPVMLGEPNTVIDALEANADRLKGVRIHQMDPIRARDYINGKFPGRLEHVSYFLGPGDREAYANGTCELVPAHFSELPLLLRRATTPALVLAASSPPDRHGYFSLGTNADYVAAFIGEVPFFLEANARMPRTCGENLVHASQLVGWCTADYELHESPPAVPDERDRQIAAFVAERIRDGDCLQIGVGRIPNALLAALTDRRDLGLHTEAMADGVMDLVESGAMNGARKRHHRNKHVATFCKGTRRLFDWLDDNRSVSMLPVDWVNNPRVVAQEPNMVSINATSEVDLMGQAASETIAGRYWSGSGGQVDFARGAMYSTGGRGFLVTHSSTGAGVSRISTRLTPGSVVTSLKNTVDHVVTEYGVAELRGRSLSRRAAALIAIAHPDHRDQLRHEARAAGLLA